MDFIHYPTTYYPYTEHSLTPHFYLCQCIYSGALNWTITPITITSASKHTSSTSGYLRVRGVTPRYRKIARGPRSKQRGGRLSGKVYQKLERSTPGSEFAIPVSDSPAKPSNRIQHVLGVPFLLQHLPVDRSRDEVVIR